MGNVPVTDDPEGEKVYVDLTKPLSHYFSLFYNSIILYL
jgi:hypothetical protein